MATINLDQLIQDSKKRREELSSYWLQQGYQLGPDGGYRYVGTPSERSMEEAIKAAQLNNLNRKEDGNEDLGQIIPVNELPNFPGYGYGTKYQDVVGLVPLSNEAVGRQGAFQTVDQLYQNINSAASNILTADGFTGRLSQAARLGVDLVQGDNPSLTTLNSSVGYLSQLVRFLGERGTLAEGDVNRALKALPKMWDTRVEAQTKLNNLKEFIKTNAPILRQGQVSPEFQALSGQNATAQPASAGPTTQQGQQATNDPLGLR